MVRRGHEVVGVAPTETPGMAAELAKLGARYVAVEMSKTGMNPAVDCQPYRALRRVCAAERPDLVLGYTIKPVVYGSLAAKAAGVKRIFAIITGLGSVYFSKGVKAAVT